MNTSKGLAGLAGLATKVTLKSSGPVFTKRVNPVLHAYPVKT